jgi:hypothetical protein
VTQKVDGAAIGPQAGGVERKNPLDPARPLTSALKVITVITIQS